MRRNPERGPEIQQEQTPEEILEVLEEALSGSPVDLVILDSNGKPSLAPDLIVDEIGEDGYIWMTYLDENGEFAGLTPLSMSRIKKAELRKKYNII